MRQQLGRNDDCGHIALSVFELQLSAAAIVVEFIDDRAGRQVLSTWHFIARCAVPVMMTLHLDGWAVRAIVVLLKLIGHRAGLDGQVEPDSRKQAQGPATPGFLPIANADHVPRLWLTTPARQVQTSRESEYDLQR